MRSGHHSSEQYVDVELWIGVVTRVNNCISYLLYEQRRSYSMNCFLLEEKLKNLGARSCKELELQRYERIRTGDRRQHVQEN